MAGKHRLAILLVLGSALAAGNAAAAPTIAQAKAVSKVALAAELRDPRSAYYERVTSRRLRTGYIVFCGEVNAKNAMGGYVGFVRFFAVDDNAWVDMPSSSTGAEPFRRAAFEEAYGKLCSAEPGSPTSF